MDRTYGKEIYFCLYSSRKTQSIERIIRSIAYGMNASIKEYAEAVYATVMADEFHNMSAEELISVLLVNPFVEHPDLAKSLDRMVVIIDGIDELRTDKVDVLTPFLDFLCDYSGAFPSFMQLVISSPQDNAINNAMRKLSAQVLDLSKEKYQENIKNDAERFLKTELDLLSIKYTDEQIQKILEKSEWNFDYLHYFLDQVCEYDESKLTLIENLPDGLAAIYEDDFTKRFSNDYYNEKVRPILEVLVAAYEPFFVNDLSQILGMNLNEVQNIIKGQLRQFLNVSEDATAQGEKVSICRVFMAEWLQKNNHCYCTDARNGADAILKWLESNNYTNYYNKNSYLKKYGLLHAMERGRDEIIVDLINNTNSDDFVCLKEDLAVLFLTDFRNQVVPSKKLISIYRNMPRNLVRVRDILVYTYRYVLKHKGNGATGLSDIYDLLVENDEVIRAFLLKGEGIEDYKEAKEFFLDIIEKARLIIDKKEGNDWWNNRMLGIAYNRLANLENRHEFVKDAEKWYGKGKECFDKAVTIIEADEQLCEAYKDDYAILKRDLAIIHERLGDISFKQRVFEKAEGYYRSYYNECFRTYNENPTLNSRWDFSISCLKMGDVKRYLGFYKKARDFYREALNLRRDILLKLRIDCAGLISNGREYYCSFECEDGQDTNDMQLDDILKESRDMEPIRDMAICYARLGDLAFCAGDKSAAGQYYDILYRLCAKNYAETKTISTESDLTFAIKRKKRILD